MRTIMLNPGETEEGLVAGFAQLIVCEDIGLDRAEMECIIKGLSMRIRYLETQLQMVESLHSENKRRSANALLNQLELAESIQADFSRLLAELPSGLHDALAIHPLPGIPVEWDKEAFRINRLNWIIPGGINCTV